MAETPDLNFVLNLPPEKVISYFRQKGYAVTFNWKEVWQEAHHKAFTVAKAMDIDLLKDIRHDVQAAIDEGLTFQDFRKNLEPRLRKRGWWGKQYMFDNDGNLLDVQLGSVERLKTIYRTNMTVAYSVGRYKEQIENADHRPYWQYLAVMDENTRYEHAALDGKVFRYDDPFWKKYYPPNDWGCRCHVRALTEDELKEEGLKVDTLPEDFNPAQFAPEEWSYNPGESFWNWDKNSQADDTVEKSVPGRTIKIVSDKTYKDFNRPDIKDLDEKHFLEQPEIFPKGQTQEEAIGILENALGISKSKPAVEINTPIETMYIQREYLPHLVEKRDNARERYANYVLQTLKDPFEIYLTEYEDGLRRQYIGLFKGKYNLLCVVRLNKDGSILWNIMNADNKGMDKRRVGDLIYYKK